jgi:hypothetical protein
MDELSLPPHLLADSNASGICWATGCADGRCRLYGLTLPCSHGLPASARQAGCWAQASAGCSTAVQPANASVSRLPLSPTRWTLLPLAAPGSAADVASCLLDHHSAIASTCPLPMAPGLVGSPHSHAALEGAHIRTAHVAVHAASGRCVASTRLLPFQTPRRGLCFSAGRRPCVGSCPR